MNFNDGIDAALYRKSNNRVYLFKGNAYVRFSSMDKGDSGYAKMDKGYPKLISESWQGMPSTFNNRINAALMRYSKNKIYLFKGSEVVRYSNVKSGKINWVKPISEVFDGTGDSDFHNGIDAALYRQSNNHVYLFKGNIYVRFKYMDQKMDKGYPQLISKNWRGMPPAFNNGIDAALMRFHSKNIYLFKGEHVVCYSNVSSGNLAGKWLISERFPGMPK